MRGDRVQQLAGDLVGISVEEAHPAQAVDGGELFKEQRETVFEAEIFAVARGVLADEGDFLHALARETLGFGDHRLEAARAKLAAKLRDDAEGARMIASFGNLDVGHVTRSEEHTSE